MMRTVSLATWVLVAALAAGCSESKSGDSTSAPPGSSREPVPAPHTLPTAIPNGPTDAGAAAEGPADAGEYAGPYIYGLFAATPIMSDMDWPVKEEQLRPGQKQPSQRIGYFRQGAKLPVFPEAHKNARCLDGWYELVQGGFVCAKYATLDPNHPKVRNASHLPDISAELPFQYGINLQNGTPLYKRLVNYDERKRYEPWLGRKRVVKRDDPTAMPAVLDAGTVFASASGPDAASQGDPLGIGLEDQDAGTPWYLREYDGGKPEVTLDELNEADPTGAIEKRMIKGFYVSLDEEMHHFGSHWWRTVKGLYAPFDRLYVTHPSTEFHGVWLNQDPSPDYLGTTVDAGLPPLPAKRIDKLPIAFVVFKTRKLTPSDDGKKMVNGDWATRFTVVPLTGVKKSINRQSYVETEDGYWLREDLVTITNPGPPPPDLAPGEKWIDVNLKNETLVAFEGDKPVYATLVSSGKRDLDDKDHDHPTHNGTFRIREKHIAATMDADTATDGPYSIEDVPWIQYFHGSIALHGAFWHSSFGQTKSHGCVNLAPNDARSLFFWTEPQIPPGWHGVMASPEHPGTRVVVHDEAKPNYETDEEEDTQQ